MEDHRFPARRNSLTQASFTYQVPASWGSPRGFFLPCRKCELPWFSRPHCHTCPISLESLALLLMNPGLQLPMQSHSSPGAVQGSCKPLPATINQNREDTHFGIAHDQGTKEQAHQQDSHGGEAGALDSGPAKEREVRRRSGGTRRRAEWVTAVQGSSP